MTGEEVKIALVGGALGALLGLAFLWLCVYIAFAIRLRKAPIRLTIFGSVVKR